MTSHSSCDVDVTNHEGKTALHDANINVKPGIVDFLMKNVSELKRDETFSDSTVAYDSMKRWPFVIRRLRLLERHTQVHVSFRSALDQLPY